MLNDIIIMGNMLSLRKWWGFNGGGDVDGGNGDACLDRTPSGVRSAIARSPGDIRRRVASFPPSFATIHLANDSIQNVHEVSIDGLVNDVNGVTICNSTDVVADASNYLAVDDHFANECYICTVVVSVDDPVTDGNDGNIDTSIDGLDFACNEYAVEPFIDCDIGTTNNVDDGAFFASNDGTVDVSNDFPVNDSNSCSDEVADTPNDSAFKTSNDEEFSVPNDVINDVFNTFNAIDAYNVGFIDADSDSTTNALEDGVVNASNDRSEDVTSDGSVHASNNAIYTYNDGTIDGTILSFNECATAIFDNDGIDESNDGAIDAPNKCCVFTSVDENLIGGPVRVSAIDGTNYLDATNSASVIIKNVCAVDSRCHLESSNVNTVDAYTNGSLVDDCICFKEDNLRSTSFVSCNVDVCTRHATINKSMSIVSNTKPSTNCVPAKCHSNNFDVTNKNVDEEPYKCGNYCHTFSSNTPCSQRTRAAAGAHLLKSNCTMMHRNARRRNNKRRRLKENKQKERLILLQSTEERRNIGKNYSIPFLKNNVVVFDGGIYEETAPTYNSDVSGWCCHKIKDGHLEVCSPPSGDKGLIYQDESDNHPRFILLPRKDAININKNGLKLCKAMSNVSKCKSNLVRGKSKTVFGKNKYCCVGSKPRRNATGVEPGQYNLKGVSREEWDCIVTAVRRSEHALYAYAATDDIRHIMEAREVVSWERIKYSNETSSGIFNGIAFGVNVYLRAHIDNDFTYSVIQVHTDCTEYKIEDDVVCYFCFPRLGIAVGLKPGDFLLVNALEYHCLSSRCYTDVDLFCVSSYLKTAVVGGNDNKRKLSEKEMDCLKYFENDKRQMKKNRNNP